MRPEDWPERLANYLATAASAGFRWGGNDCLFFAANWIGELTGADPVPHLRARWSNANEALRVLATEGGSYFEAADSVLASLGFERVAPVALHRGDICFMDDDTGFGGSLGIMADTRAAFLTDSPAQPLVFVPRARLRAGWRIA